MIKILKFGGSSIKTADRIKHIVEIVRQQQNGCENIAIVVSAIGGMTDLLIEISENIYNSQYSNKLIEKFKNCHIEICKNLKIDFDKELEQIILELNSVLDSNLKSLTSKLKDEIISNGERFSSLIIAKYFSSIGIKSESLDARKVILTDDHFGSAFVHYKESYHKIRGYFSKVDSTQIITGFIGATENGETTTLGRSGSDYTASIFGAALNADEIQIWTDVDGILSANPKIVKNAKPIDNLNYKEALELAHAGAKVIFPPTMIPALYKNIPIWIKNTFNPKNNGSLITRKSQYEDRVAVGISSQSGMAMVRLQGAGMVGLYGLIGRIFTALAKKKINIVLVSQVFSEHSICFVIQPDQIEISKKLLNEEFEFELKNYVIDKIIIENKLSLLALVGEGMRHKSGISGRLFKTLGNKNINIIAIAQGSSERNISLIVEDAQVDEALQILHSEFFEDKTEKTAIYLAGIGIVGGELLNILSNLKSEKLTLNGILRSKSMYLNSSGINLKNWKQEFDFQNENHDLNKFLQLTTKIQNKIFVDCTTSESLAQKYDLLLSNGFSIVAANKKANTLDYIYYSKIQNIVANQNVQFKYETNVGAGLPVISTIQSLLESGDKIHKIEGIFSGTLSFLFNNFNGEIPFSELVFKAKNNGYTEPDPREDLNGEDVARKLLILAREIGVSLELEDVKTESLLPEKSDSYNSTDDFLNFFKIADSHFSQLLDNANHKNKRLRYIGSLENGKAEVKLQSISSSHPFYHLEGSENIIAITTDRYIEKPLVIRGHGAGAEVTAGGVMADIMSILETK